MREKKYHEENVHIPFEDYGYREEFLFFHLTLDQSSSCLRTI